MMVICRSRIRITFSRCLLSVKVLALLALVSSNGLFKVGKASLFNRTRNVSSHSIRSRNCGECPGSYASSAKWSEQILLLDNGLNALRLQNSTHAFLLICWDTDFPFGNAKKCIPLGFFLASLLQPYTGQYDMFSPSLRLAIMKQQNLFMGLIAIPQTMLY